MSSLTFKAVIGAVHFDPKKGTVKIQLEATSYVSLDGLASLGPQDESIRITLESEQTRIDEHPLAPTTEEPATTDAVARTKEESEEWLKMEASRLRDSPDGEEDETEGGGQGGII